MHKNGEFSVNKDFSCRTMVRTRASETTSSLAARQRLRHAPLQEAQDLESEPEVVMEDVESGDAARHKPSPGEPIRKASTIIYEEDAELVYNHTRFQRDKVKHRYIHYYHERRITVEKGVIIKEFDECTSRVQAVLDTQGWMDMAEDHRLTIKEIV